MLRIIAGTLLSGTILSGAAASSFLSPAPIEAGSGPSFMVMDAAREVALPVDTTITASHGAESEPQVIAAPRFVSVSASVTAMPPAPEDAVPSTSIAAVGEESEAVPEPAQPQRFARQLEPMVIRGGLVGMAFPPAAPQTQPQGISSPESAAAPSGTSSAPPVDTGAPEADRSGGATEIQRQQQPAPRPDGRL